MKIAISGAGVAGPALAYWLHRTGHTPTLIERASQFRTGGYVIDFWGLGYRVAQRMGIESAVRDAGYQMRELRLVDREGRIETSVDVDAFRRATDGKYTSITRGDLAAAIYGTIENDVEAIFGTSITAIDEQPHGVQVEFDTTQAREFDLVIGADGLHSTVRELAFGPEPCFEHYLGCLVAACVVDGYQPRDELVYVTHNLPGRHIGRFTLRGNRTLFFFIFRSDHLHDVGDITTAKARLRREFADAGWECPQILAALDDVDDLYFDVVSQIKMDRWSRGRVLLIGDAAACVSLLAGEGTGLAITEAYVLAGELARADNDYHRAFPAYEAHMRAFIEDKQAGARKFISFFTPRTSLGIRTRNLAMRAMNIPPFADLLLARTFVDHFQLPDYAI
ncbi:FAD-binding domain [Mycolicibacterium sp. CH28]|uniref:FAD-binding domain n=1 Tax=Mycolicibacterium sp. CH28 TaxID=2512237 RepID=UPI0010821FF2|nr:FAD-binding domain [Mycolicibacterium sp. CH28]TGD86165.1 FAD-binding domain [Mycolicibacterium sp. CH28]